MAGIMVTMQGRLTPTEPWMLAVESRDGRFDGWIFVGVTSTGIYCRPSCPTPIRPARKNMAFFATPAAAQHNGFRSCKRCTPDAVPGSPEWNRRDDLVARALRAIDAGVVERDGIEGLASALHCSSRHLSRILTQEIGASPKALANARRCRIARSLVRETDLPMSDIAFAAGFESVRQFNHAMKTVFDTAPSTMRKATSGRTAVTGGSGGWVDLSLSYRQPFDAAQVFGWHAAHSIRGLEHFDGSVYRRSLRGASGPVIIEVSDVPTRSAVRLRVRLSSLSDLPVVINKVRRLFDLDADPAIVAATLREDPKLRPLVDRYPGLRVPGDVDGGETLMRIIVHQQVAVASATSTLARLVASYGQLLDEPVGDVCWLFPTPAAIATRLDDSFATTRAKRATLVRVASALAAGDISITPYGSERSQTIAAVAAIKGIGPWTTSLLALRSLGDPDVWCPGDLALQTAASSLGIDDLGAAAESWRPWRSYAMHYLWALYGQESSKGA